MEASYATMRDSRQIIALLEELELKRVAMKLRVTDLCRMAGISTKTWYQWHAGKRHPRIKIIESVKLTLETYQRSLGA